MNRINKIICLGVVLVLALAVSNVQTASLNINIQPQSIWGDEKSAQVPVVIPVQVPAPEIKGTSSSAGPTTGILTSLLPGAVQNFTSQLPIVGGLKLPSLPIVGDMKIPSLPIVGDMKIPSLPAVGSLKVPSLPNLPNFGSFLKKRDLMEEYDGYE